MNFTPTVITFGTYAGEGKCTKTQMRDTPYEKKFYTSKIVEMQVLAENRSLTKQ